MSDCIHRKQRQKHQCTSRKYVRMLGTPAQSSASHPPRKPLCGAAQQMTPQLVQSTTCTACLGMVLCYSSCGPAGSANHATRASISPGIERLQMIHPVYMLRSALVSSPVAPPRQLRPALCKRPCSMCTHLYTNIYMVLYADPAAQHQPRSCSQLSAAPPWFMAAATP
jgi:hypothetical protein